MKLVDLQSLKRLALFPIAIIVIVVIFFDVFNVASSVPPLLLPILNTLFLGVIFLAGAIVCARVFLANGSWQTTLIGSGMLSIGLTAPVAGWLAPQARMVATLTL